MKLILSTALVALLVQPTLVQADSGCKHPTSCQESELKAAEAKLSEVYKAVKVSLSQSEKNQLKQQQQQWLDHMLARKQLLKSLGHEESLQLAATFRHQQIVLRTQQLQQQLTLIQSF